MVLRKKVAYQRPQLFAGHISLPLQHPVELVGKELIVTDETGAVLLQLRKLLPAPLQSFGRLLNSGLLLLWAKFSAQQVSGKIPYLISQDRLQVADRFLKDSYALI